MARAASAAERTHRSSNSTSGALEGSTPFSVCAAAPVVCASRQARSAIGMLTSWEPLSAGFTITSMHLHSHGAQVSSVRARLPEGHCPIDFLSAERWVSYDFLFWEDI